MAEVSEDDLLGQSYAIQKMHAQNWVHRQKCQTGLRFVVLRAIRNKGELL